MHVQNFGAILFITVYAEFCSYWDNCDIFTRTLFSLEKKKKFPQIL